MLIESTDDLPAERQRCFQLLRNHLEQVPGLELRMFENQGYESLVALPQGIVQPEILLCGHLDVVKHLMPGSYQSEIRGDRIYGAGAGDMKGQLAIMIELIRHLNQEQPGISLGLAVTSDEERGGEHGVKFLVEEIGLRCGLAIIPDGGSLVDVTEEEKGIIHLRLTSEGISGHAARPWLGENAIDRLVDSIAKVREHFAKFLPERICAEDTGTHWFPTCTATVLATDNESPNRIPDHARAVLDIRFVPPYTADTLLQEIRALLATGVTAEPIVMAEPSHLAPDPLYLEITEAVLGVAPRLTKASGGSDGRFFAHAGIPVILSRPTVGNLHGHDEWIDISSMLDYFEICRRHILARTNGGAEMRK
ncbi:MAG: M20/M25/M40 family metallo-hydrolase [Luteolibacter sp.]